MYVYVLRLQDDCWYVGKSANVERRLQQHIDAAGAVWTELDRSWLLRFAEFAREEDLAGLGLAERPLRTGDPSAALLAGAAGPAFRRLTRLALVRNCPFLWMTMEKCKLSI
jgi:hypothetical protein